MTESCWLRESDCCTAVARCQGRVLQTGPYECMSNEQYQQYVDECVDVYMYCACCTLALKPEDYTFPLRADYVLSSSFFLLRQLAPFPLYPVNQPRADVASKHLPKSL